MDCPKKRCKGIIEWVRIVEDLKFAHFKARGVCGICGKVVLTTDRTMLTNGQVTL
jgi:hypothetical protein